MARKQNSNYESNSTALSTEVQAPRLPYPAQAAEFGIEKSQWLALVDAVFPSARTVQGVMLALSYAKARNLDVFKRTVHVVPMYNAALGREVETVWPGIGEVRTTAQRTGQCAGIDDCQFGPEITATFQDSKQGERKDGGKYTVTDSCPPITYPSWAQITVYRMVDGQRCAFVGPKVRFIETYSGSKGLKVPNARWQRAPYQMMEKCAEAAAWRRAFPEECGDMQTSDEMEGKIVSEVVEGEFTDVSDQSDAGDQGKPDPGQVRKEHEEAANKFKLWLDRLKPRLNKCDNITDLMTERKKYEEQTRDHVDPMHLDMIDRLFDAARIRIQDVENRQFVDDFKAECAKRRGNMIDLNSLWADVKDTIEGLPDDFAAECEEAFEAAKPDAPEGNAAAEGDSLLPQTENDDEQTGAN